jgi:hypothetical protein
MFNGDVVYICRHPCIDGFDTFSQFGYCCQIKDLLENMRSNYKQCVAYGKPTNPTNIIYSQRILSREVFRKRHQ